MYFKKTREFELYLFRHDEKHFKCNVHEFDTKVSTE